MNFKIEIDPFVLVIVMAVELGVGLLIGILSREFAKLKARDRAQNLQVFSRAEYRSRGYGSDDPENFFNAFGLNYNLVVVQSDPLEVIQEEFYTPLGDCLKVEYLKDGRERTISSFWSAPLYATAVVLPLILGFLLCMLLAQIADRDFERSEHSIAFAINLGACIFISGMLWFALLYWIPSFFWVMNKAKQSVRSNPPPLSEPPPTIVVNPLEPEEAIKRVGKRSWMWLSFIFLTIFLALFWHWHSLEYIAKDPTLKSGYRTLILGFLFWANVPWLVMGAGCLKNNLTMRDYLQPRSLHPSLLAFFASVLAVFAIGSYWIAIAGGAEMLVNYPGLWVGNSGEVLDSQALAPGTIKFWWFTGVVSGVLAMSLTLSKVRSESQE